MAYNARFHAFLVVSELAEKLLPGVRHYTAEQVDLIHEYADKLAKDLTSGDYLYHKK